MEEEIVNSSNFLETPIWTGATAQTLYAGSGRAKSASCRGVAVVMTKVPYAVREVRPTRLLTGEKTVLFHNTTHPGHSSLIGASVKSEAEELPSDCAP